MNAQTTTSAEGSHKLLLSIIGVLIAAVSFVGGLAFRGGQADAKMVAQGESLRVLQQQVEQLAKRQEEMGLTLARMEANTTKLPEVERKVDELRNEVTGLKVSLFGLSQKR